MGSVLDQHAVTLCACKRAANLRRDLERLRLDLLDPKDREKLASRLQPVAEFASQLNQEQSSLMAHCRELESFIGDVLRTQRSLWLSWEHEPDIVPLLSR